jgi:hypothetical protein
MSDANPFGKFVPGFDFLQNLAKGAAGNIPQLPNPSKWVAPTLNVEELDKRISELKAVQFWLDQNAKALAATITALEVQKMTLATLKGMNFNMGDFANAFKLKAADSVVSAVTNAKDRVTDTMSGKKPVASKKSAGTSPSATGIIDPVQLWSSLTQQFGEIARSAMKDAARQNARDTTKNVARAMTQTAFNTAKSTAGHMAKTASNAANQTMQRMSGASAGNQAVGNQAVGNQAAAKKTAVKKPATKRKPTKKATAKKK